MGIFKGGGATSRACKEGCEGGVKEGGGQRECGSEGV